jgi:hypothetical protein
MRDVARLNVNFDFVQCSGVLVCVRILSPNGGIGRGFCALAACRRAPCRDTGPGLPIAHPHTEIESRERAIWEIARRADALESAAGERLAAMAATDSVIATLQTEIGTLHKRLEGARLRPLPKGRR